jgi:hypothetical protein
VVGVDGVAVIDLVWDLRASDVTVADRVTVTSMLADVAGVRRWLDGVEVACARRLEVLAEGDPSIFPERDIATATRTSLARAARAAARAKTAARVRELGDALADGTVSGEHVDAVTAALKDLTEPQRRLLAGHGERLTRLAAELTPDEFRRQVANLVRSIEADDGKTKLERQRRACRLRAWLDQHTGMVRLSGEFDPETGAKLINRLNTQIETLFHDTVPALCPDDPQARLDFLRAHALLALTNGGGGAGWRTELSIVADLQTLVHGWHEHSRVDCGIDGLDLPLDTIRRIALYADIIPVLLDDNGVILKLGRTRRLATAGQRRALRAMYKTCAIRGCRRPSAQCTPHHCDEFGHGGLTDIELLVPICKHHHTMIHAHGWTLTLSADRSLTITAPDGTTIMTTGPPSEQWQ